MSIALPINRHMFIDRRKSISSVFPKKQPSLKKIDEGHQKSAQLAKRRLSTPHAPLQDVLFGQALFKISDTVRDLCTGIPVDPLPKAAPTRSKGVAHAPKRELNLTPEQEKGVVLEALQYFPIGTHDLLGPEFLEELRNYGHIYMYRFRPTLKMRAYPLCHYPVKTHQAAAAMQMIMGMLDQKLAKYPHELISYDGKGQVFSNWAQFWLTMYYLSIMTEEQTLVIFSGHPNGLFPSFPSSPRVVVTNGIMKMPKSPFCPDGGIFAMGVSMFGHIGLQATVHATMITMRCVYRKFMKSGDLAGKVFLSSGLGKMGCAQAIASLMNGCIGVIAEVDQTAIEKLKNEEWLTEVISDVDELVHTVRKSKEEAKAKCIAYHGNVVDLWERFAEELENTGKRLVDLGTDQTNLLKPFTGGYVPAQLSLEDMEVIMAEKPEKFKKCVQKCLRYHVLAINKLVEDGMIFWEYGNGFQSEAHEAGAEIQKPGAPDGVYRYPKYGKEILGDILAVGFSPFRWTFTSGSPNDIAEMDREVVKILERIALANIEELPPVIPTSVHDYYQDSIKWMKEVQKHKWSASPMSRMLYTDVRGKIAIGTAFNNAIRTDIIKGPVVLSRDYHDAQIIGNAFRKAECRVEDDKLHSDLSIQDCMGDSFRGATWISMNNTQNSGLRQIVDGGFGLVIDGSEESEKKAKITLSWDAVNGVAHRSWKRDMHSKATVKRGMKDNHQLQITIPHIKSADSKAYRKPVKGLN